jgi:hypothetical protein
MHNNFRSRVPGPPNCVPDIFHINFKFNKLRQHWIGVSRLMLALVATSVFWLAVDLMVVGLLRKGYTDSLPLIGMHIGLTVTMTTCLILVRKWFQFRSKTRFSLIKLYKPQPRNINLL